MQTQEFAEAIIRATDMGNEALSRRGLKYRLARQRVLDREDPPKVSAIIEESALIRPIGGPEVMRGQLEHLAALAERPTIEIRVLPHATGAHPGLTGSFHMFELRDLLIEKETDVRMLASHYTTTWRVSSYSSSLGSNCFEVGIASTRFAVRDSKDRGGPVLAFDRGTWRAFLAGTKEGRFDLG